MKKNKNTKKKSKVFGNILFVTIILGIMTWLGIEEYKDKKIENQSNYLAEELMVSNRTKEEIFQETKKVYPKEELIETYQGYQVEAKLEIPKIELSAYVLKEFSEKALNQSIVRFWGAKPNQSGNFCIAGHNFKYQNMFYHLKELEIGDSLILTDREVGKVTYEIYEIYKVIPEDVSCLSQETKGKKEVTLITCTNDSEQRIIVKAREKE